MQQRELFNYLFHFTYTPKFSFSNSYFLLEKNARACTPAPSPPPCILTAYIPNIFDPWCRLNINQALINWIDQGDEWTHTLGNTTKPPELTIKSFFPRYIENNFFLVNNSSILLLLFFLFLSDLHLKKKFICGTDDQEIT